MKNVALIGVGKWGKNIAATLDTIPDASLKYEVSHDWKELLPLKDIDAVLVATPSPSHAEIAIAFLKQNVPVFVEKPMALNMKEAEAIKEAVQKSDGVFMVGYQYIYNDYINLLKKEIENGAFGEIIEMKSEHMVSPPRPDTDILYDAGSHSLAIFKYLFNPSALLGAEGAIDHGSADVKIKFDKGPILVLRASHEGDVKTRKLTIVGEKMTAVLDETKPDNKLTLLQNGKEILPHIDFNPPLRNEMLHFLKCIESGYSPLTDINFGYTINEWLDSISTKTNQ